MAYRARSPLRLLAPLALAAATLVFLLVLTGSLDGDDRDAATTAPAADRAGGGDRGSEDGRPEEETYEVQSGDTLDAIAAETGVSVERIQELNPELDPQSLIAGQEIKLRK